MLNRMSKGKKLKIAFFVPDLSGGGAERIVVTFLENINRELFDPVLIVCQFSGVHCEKVPKDVPVFSLNKTSRTSFIPLIFNFKKIIAREKPDIVISFLWYADSIQLLAKTKHSPIAVCSFHTVPNAIIKEKLGWLKVLLLKSLYKKADMILGVSQSVVNDINQLLLKGQRNEKTLVQFNPFDFDDVMQSAQHHSCWDKAHKGRIIFVGRLEWVKGPDLLIDILAGLPEELNWHAKFLGTGSMQSELLSQTEKLGLNHKIDFEGFVANPFPDISEADILVVTSRFEAFPSVIVEALQLQTAVVSYNCPTGPSEIINANNGILVQVGQTEEFSNIIQRLIEHPEQIKELAENGPESVSHLSCSKATKLLEKHLLNAAKR